MPTFALQSIEKEMSYSIKDFEIMAPVGSRESLAAALHAGADSIYFRIESLNMRARSANTFTIDDLREIAKVCDEHGVKSYLTINTIIYDEDLELMRKIVDAAKGISISFVTIEALEISSSELRRRLAEGKSIRYLTPQVVVDHVMEHEFYREGVEHG